MPQSIFSIRVDYTEYAAQHIFNPSGLECISYPQLVLQLNRTGYMMFILSMFSCLHVVFAPRRKIVFIRLFFFFHSTGNAVVPNVALLGWPEEKLSVVYSNTSKHSATSEQEFVDWHASWEAYVRGNMVSTSAAGLIRSFLLKTIAASASQLDDGDSSDDQGPYDDPDIPLVKLDARKLSSILNPYRPGNGRTVQCPGKVRTVFR